MHAVLLALSIITRSLLLDFATLDPKRWTEKPTATATHTRTFNLLWPSSAPIQSTRYAPASKSLLSLA